MVKFVAAVALAGTTTISLSLLAAAATGQSSMPFGGDDDVRFSRALWDALVEERLAGPERINVHPFQGNEPHGSIQQVLATELTVNGRTAEVLVKHNHGGPDATVESVYEHPNRHLSAVTVMYEREDGYDPENRDWFWAKYLPDGSLDKNPAGVQLAGRVAKGANAGCIACHRALGGADMETLTSQ